MTLVDTSVWIDHFRKPDVALLQLLSDGRAGIHPFIVGELACGNFKDRAGALRSLQALPRISVAGDAELYYLLETYRLWGTGLGWVDLHVLASAAVSGWRLLTADHALQRAAAKVGIPRG
jgi:predicted nucleic acid-binding protein